MGRVITREKTWHLRYVVSPPQKKKKNKQIKSLSWTVFFSTRKPHPLEYRQSASARGHGVKTHNPSKTLLSFFHFILFFPAAEQPQITPGAAAADWILRQDFLLGRKNHAALTRCHLQKTFGIVKSTGKVVLLLLCCCCVVLRLLFSPVECVGPLQLHTCHCYYYRSGGKKRKKEQLIV